jgi:spore coat polysaccharide biosynthesis protein SpsF
MNTAILITARLRSTRLALKVIKPIHERPMISHLIERLKRARIPQRIILCTSVLEQDDPLVEIAATEKVECFRGHPDDVLLRLTDAATKFGIDVVVSCTADNPFVDPEYIDRLLEFHVREGNDYSRSEGLPLGAFAYALSLPAMRRACELKAQTDTEVWGGYFTETGKFRWGTMSVTDPSVRWPELRLTVDTPQDFELVTRVFDELGRAGRIFSLREIVDLCRRRPDLVAINSSIQQKPGIPIRLRSDVLSV